jgi:hypothetical protein
LRLLGLALRRLAASLPALAMIIVGLFLLLQFARAIPWTRWWRRSAAAMPR